MHHHFQDIIGRLGAPAWWDRCGFPRYCEFKPDVASDIYASEAALVLIACQDCDTQFRVCITWSSLDLLRGKPQLADIIREGSIHYGDPPNNGCCAAGPTMNCLDLRVLEYWHQVDHEWMRDATLEIDLPDNRRSDP